MLSMLQTTFSVYIYRVYRLLQTDLQDHFRVCVWGGGGGREEENYVFEVIDEYNPRRGGCGREYSLNKKSEYVHSLRSEF